MVCIRILGQGEPLTKEEDNAQRHDSGHMIDV